MTVAPVFPYLDQADLQRAAVTVDAEGSGTETWTSVGTRWGAWGSTTSQQRTYSSRAGQEVDAYFSGPFYDALVGDRLVDLRGSDYVIVDFHDTVLHRRHFLRQIDA